ncbi:MAG: MMPL family transporter [Chromatiales bacterium]|nr:MAG: MMPL family transporter [Chromatiales bacterium]
MHRVLSFTSPSILGAATSDPDFREKTLANSVLTGTLLTADARTAAIVVQVTREGNTFANKRTLVEALRSIVSGETSGIPVQVSLSGTPVTDDAAMRHNEHDLRLMIPIMIAIIVVFAQLIFRRLMLALLPLIVVLMAAIWAYGLMGLSGLRTTLISTALLPLLLAVGVADSIHVIAHYRRLLATGNTREIAVERTIARLLTPCFFTSATTAAGLLSLLTSDLEPIREFAVVAAAGVMAAFVISMLFLPTALGLLRVPEQRYLDRQSSSGLSALLGWLGSMPRAVERLIVPAFAIGSVAFIVLAARVQVGADPMSWFPEDDPARLDTERIDAALGGSVSLEFLVTTAEGGLREPAALARLDEFERWLEENTAISRVLSVADILKEAMRVAQGEESKELQLPKTTLVTDMLLDGLDRRGYQDLWVSADYSVGRLSARVPLSRATELIGQVPAIETQMKAHFADDALQVEMTGYARLMATMEKYVIEGQIESLAMAFAVITLMMVLLFRSWRLALFAMIPNLTPIAVGLGAMYLMGIGLNPGTVMVGAIALGIVVDDTVHFLTAFRRYLRDRMHVNDAIGATIEEVGRPVVITSLILAASFAVLTLGRFVPSQQVGLVTAIIVLTALLADLVLLPAALRIVPWRVTREPAAATHSDKP